jgi:hypothetical protein
LFLFCVYAVTLFIQIKKQKKKKPMRIELWILLLCGSALFIVYYDIPLWSFSFVFQTYRKHVYAVTIVALAIMMYSLCKMSSRKTAELIHLTHEYLKYLPVDGKTSVPAFDFMSSSSSREFRDVYDPLITMPTGTSSHTSTSASMQLMDTGNQRALTRMLHSGKENQSKRSVSETKKKFVASSQGWKCAQCKQTLPAWFEVDHIVRLENGGSNHIDNLVAYCRNCHGLKTSLENL